MQKMIAWCLWCVLLCHSEPAHIYETPPQRRICLIINREFRGEREFAQRVRIACENLNWKIRISDTFPSKRMSRHFHWILTLVPKVAPYTLSNNYLVLFDPLNHYFSSDGKLHKNFLNYRGYLATYQNTELLSEELASRDQALYPKPWYPTAYYRPYQKVTPTRLFYFVGVWGNRVNERHIILQNKLAQEEYTYLFGFPEVGKDYGEAFRGAIKYDGKSVIECIGQMGVCLIMHSEVHNQHAIPSGRIFEALAASAVIISDRNPFVVEHFGDTVLYIDEELSGEEMFEQVNEHMMWIKENPEEALEMAEGAHDIFEEKFLLEQQLLDFDRFVESQNEEE